MSVGIERGESLDGASSPIHDLSKITSGLGITGIDALFEEREKELNAGEPPIIGDMGGVDRLINLSHAVSRENGQGEHPGLNGMARNLLVRGLGRDLPSDAVLDPSIISATEVVRWVSHKADGAAQAMRRRHKAPSEVKTPSQGRRQPRAQRVIPASAHTVQRSDPRQSRDAAAVLAEHSRRFKNIRQATASDTRPFRIGERFAFLPRAVLVD